MERSDNRLLPPVLNERWRRAVMLQLNGMALDQVTEWKRQLLERAADVFDGGAAADQKENVPNLKDLHAKWSRSAYASAQEALPNAMGAAVCRALAESVNANIDFA